MNRFRKHSKKDIDNYWWVAEEHDPRPILAKLISRHVVDALKEAERETNLSLDFNWEDIESGKAKKAKVELRWASLDYPGGSDVFKGSWPLQSAVDDLIGNHTTPHGDNSDLLVVADEFDRMARRIRKAAIG